jgi:aspergillopepsin I
MPNFTITFTPSALVASFIQPSSSGGINTQPYHAVIPGEYFIGNPTGKNDGMCQAGINNVGSGQAWDIILGDVFLMSQLVVFDMADPNGSVDSNYPSHGQIGKLECMSAFGSTTRRASGCIASMALEIGMR